MVEFEDEKTDPGIPRPEPAASQASQTPGPPVRMPELGPLEPFMKDPAITEIMVNDIRNVMIERDGKMSFSGFTYPSLDDLNRFVRNLLDFTGRVLTPDQPYVDGVLPDGSRIHIIGPPLAVGGPSITIRKFPSRRLTIDDLMASQTLDRRIAYFLNLCVLGRRNILISGGAGSGKTTLLNVLTSFIPKTERIVTIEDTPELSLGHPNSVRLQTKPQTPMLPAITTRDLLANALRMRPDRIIVGECRTSEALDMLQAMNTGHAGSMTTLHANSPRDALARLETLCMMAGVDVPLLAIRKQISNSVDLLVQVKRFRNGSRRVVAVSELTGIEGDTVTLQEIFTCEGNEDSAVNFKCTGFVPTFAEELREQGLEFPAQFFG